MNSTPGPSSSGAICSAEIGLVDPIDLGGDLQRNAERARDLDGPVGPLLRRDAPEKREIAAARLEDRPVQVDRQAVIDGLDKIRARHRLPLRIGDRDQRHVVEADIERQQIGQILPAMQSWSRSAPRWRETAENGTGRCGNAGRRNRRRIRAPGPASACSRGSDRLILGSSRSAVGAQLTSFADVIESPLANSVTS